MSTEKFWLIFSFVGCFVIGQMLPHLKGLCAPRLITLEIPGREMSKKMLLQLKLRIKHDFAFIEHTLNIRKSFRSEENRKLIREINMS